MWMPLQKHQAILLTTHQHQKHTHPAHSQIHTSENLMLMLTCFITGKPGAMMPHIHTAKCTAFVAKPSDSDLQYPRSEDKSELLIQPLLQLQGRVISCSYCYPEPSSCLTKTNLGSVWEKSRLMPTTDIRTQRGSTTSPPSALPQDWDRCGLLPA